MKADVWWVVGGALTVFLTVLGVLVDRYLCAVYWWPLVGTEWRAARADYWPSNELPEDDDEYDYEAAQGGYREPWDEPEDETWADQLHVINLDAHRDRPIHQLTHYEVEAVIRDLGVPEWVPQRYRTAA